MSAAPEIDLAATASVRLRRLTPQERALWAPALQIHYRELVGVEVMMTPEEYRNSILFGEVLVVEYAGQAAGAVHLAAVSPGDAADVHIVRWSPMPKELWVEACRSVVRWAFTELRLLRIEAYIPETSKGAITLAPAVGFKLVGRIPKGLVLPEGQWIDTELWVLVEEDLHG